MLMEPKIEEFISNLVANLKSERVFDSIEKDIEFRKKDWDTVAKSKVGNVVKKVFRAELFPKRMLRDQPTSKVNMFRLNCSWADLKVRRVLMLSSVVWVFFQTLQ